MFLGYNVNTIRWIVQGLSLSGNSGLKVEVGIPSPKHVVSYHPSGDDWHPGFFSGPHPKKTYVFLCLKSRVLSKKTKDVGGVVSFRFFCFRFGFSNVSPFSQASRNRGPGVSGLDVGHQPHRGRYRDGKSMALRLG